MNGFNILVVEDSPERIRTFKRKLVGNAVTFALSARDGISHLRSGTVDVLFLDHDLKHVPFEESGPGTGYEVALFLSKNPQFMPAQVIIHSLNPVGADNMHALLPEAEKIPFVWDKL